MNNPIFFIGVTASSIHIYILPPGNIHSLHSKVQCNKCFCLICHEKLVLKITLHGISCIIVQVMKKGVCCSLQPSYVIYHYYKHYYYKLLCCVNLPVNHLVMQLFKAPGFVLIVRAIKSCWNRVLKSKRWNTSLRLQKSQK